MDYIVIEDDVWDGFYRIVSFAPKNYGLLWGRISAALKDAPLSNKLDHIGSTFGIHSAGNVNALITDLDNRSSFTGGAKEEKIQLLCLALDDCKHIKAVQSVHVYRAYICPNSVPICVKRSQAHHLTGDKGLSVLSSALPRQKSDSARDQVSVGEAGTISFETAKETWEKICGTLKAQISAQALPTIKVAYNLTGLTDEKIWDTLASDAKFFTEKDLAIHSMKVFLSVVDAYRDVDAVIYLAKYCEGLRKIASIDAPKAAPLVPKAAFEAKKAISAKDPIPCMCGSFAIRHFTIPCGHPLCDDCVGAGDEICRSEHCGKNILRYQAIQAHFK